jgi:ligand-binding SRPBCC domain-containing protein
MPLRWCVTFYSKVGRNILNRQHFQKKSRIAASAERVFAFHERPDAFALLQPPWQTTEIIQPPASLAVGTRVILKTKIGPLWQTIEAEHVEYERGRMFADRMVKGPFSYWLHRHIVEPISESQCYLIDDIEYALPMGALGNIFGGWFARRELERLFEYRHDVTRDACR